MHQEAILSYFGTAPLELAWSLRFLGSPDQAWAVFSNTHLMNRRVGMQVRYEQRHDPDGTPHRIGTMRAFGRDVTFEEDLFDYEAPHHIFIQRRFEEGPVTTYTLSIDIKEIDPGRTQVDYRVCWFPRNAAARLFVRALFPSVYGPPITRALNSIEVALQEEEFREPSDSQLDLLPNASRVVRELCSKLEDREVAGLVQRLLLEGDDELVRRIHVPVLSRSWKIPLHRLLDAFLQAVSLGLLEVRWELLCPSCQGPSQRSVKLDPEGLEGHCPSCNIAYNGNFADSVGVSFSVPSTIRAVEESLLCVGSPSWTPHILSRAELPPQTTGSWTLDMAPGGYRLRGLDSIAGAHLEVREDGTASEVTVTLEEVGIRPLRLLVRPGPVKIFVKSRRDVPTRVVLEDRWRPRDVLTAGHLLERPRARELLPNNILPSDLSCVVRPVGILACELLAEPQEQLPRLGSLLRLLEPTQVLTTDRAVYSTWRSMEGALDAAARLEGAWQLFNSVSHGAVLEMELGSRREPAGRALEDAAGALRSALPGRCVMSERARTHPDVDSLLQPPSPSIHLEAGPLFEDRQDFLVEFLADQPSPKLAPLQPQLPPIDGMSDSTFGGRYALGECLGSGGFGVVYNARDVKDQSRSVVKLLRPELFTGSEAVQLFFREARALSMLDDPAVVRFQDFGHDDKGRLFLVMEHLEGRDLKVLLEERGPLSDQRAITIASGMLRGLAATHNAGLLHRDIKPSNVFLVEGGDGGDGIRLIDFGIAVDLIEVNEEQPDGKVVGTLPFMAPEQLRAEALCPATDLYAVGIVLWKMLTGKLPYQGMTAMQSAVRRVQQGTPSIRTEFPGVSKQLAAVIDQALAMEPKDRYAKAEDMLEALDEASQS